MKLIIRDWCGTRCFPDKEFDTLEDAESFILAEVPEDEVENYYIDEED